ncbi:MAG: hypothetical protein M1826_000408 [Phylliscum demangeonii]|nr:MAG: hypothetical protein M1826_000408 [Phylliscum demangeonii]
MRKHATLSLALSLLGSIGSGAALALPPKNGRADANPRGERAAMSASMFDLSPSLYAAGPLAAFAVLGGLRLVTPDKCLAQELEDRETRGRAYRRWFGTQPPSSRITLEEIVSFCDEQDYRREKIDLTKFANKKLLEKGLADCMAAAKLLERVMQQASHEAEGDAAECIRRWTLPPTSGRKNRNRDVLSVANNLGARAMSRIGSTINTVRRYLAEPHRMVVLEKEVTAAERIGI